jgi:hypothetical protein
MDVDSQIVTKRAAAARFRQSAGKMSGDYRIQVLVYAAELEIQADMLEHQLLAPALPTQWFPPVEDQAVLAIERR